MKKNTEKTAFIKVPVEALEGALVRVKSDGTGEVVKESTVEQRLSEVEEALRRATTPPVVITQPCHRPHADQIWQRPYVTWTLLGATTSATATGIAPSFTLRALGTGGKQQ